MHIVYHHWYKNGGGEIHSHTYMHIWSHVHKISLE